LKKSNDLEFRTSRRKGIKEKLLLSHEESLEQNIVLMDMEPDSTVEYHEVSTNESIFVLQGKLAVTFADFSRELHPGDLCYFPKGTWHGLKCLEGPVQYLAIFSPSSHKKDN